MVLLGQAATFQLRSKNGKCSVLKLKGEILDLGFLGSCSDSVQASLQELNVYMDDGAQEVASAEDGGERQRGTHCHETGWKRRYEGW